MTLGRRVDIRSRNVVVMSESEKKPSLMEAGVFLTTIIILGILIITAGAASYLIPAGAFEEIVKNGETVKVYRTISQTPIPVWKIALSPLLSLTGKNGAKIIVLTLFILIIGGSFSIMNKSGTLPSLLTRLVDRYQDRRTMFLVVNVIVFALLGSCLGILEEIAPMILIFVPIAYRMGWDSVTGCAIPFLSAGFGFSAATFNPFTVGTAQKLADLPLFSGLSLRIPLFIIVTAMVIFYLLRYTRRIERDPSRGLMFGRDEGIRQRLAPEFPSSAFPVGRVVTWIVVCFSLVVGVVGVGMVVGTVQDLAFPLIALVFLVMGLGAGLLAGLGAGTVFKLFYKGLADFSPAILLILMAAAVGYLVETGNIMDTILHIISGQVAGLGRNVAVLTLYAFQMLMNFFVPSGTGQAVLTIPILAPLGDLIGISRQTVVLAFQCGDGFSNLIWPTNPLLLIAIGLAGLGYRDWFRWLIPLQLCLVVVCALFLILAVHTGYA